MEDYECWELKDGVLEYFDDTHTYLFNGLVLPSITQILGIKFGNKYNNVSEHVLEQAAIKGTRMHLAIQQYEEKGTESDIPELLSYKFLKKHFKWEVKKCEIPVVLFLDDKPIAAGRLDLLIEQDGKLGIYDLKRTSGFDKEYVCYQTNLYRIAYRQTYGEEPELLGGIHLREEKRKFYPLPVAENMAWSLVHQYLRGKDENNS